MLGPRPPGQRGLARGRRHDAGVDALRGVGAYGQRLGPSGELLHGAVLDGAQVEALRRVEQVVGHEERIGAQAARGQILHRVVAQARN